MKNHFQSILIFFLLLPIHAMAGDLENAGNPTAGSGMPTLTDIYNRLATGATITPYNAFREPSSGPTSGTGRTLSEIKDKLPVPDDANGATIADVQCGKTFWGLRSDGTWGTLKGTRISALSKVVAPEGGSISGTICEANNTGFGATLTWSADLLKHGIFNINSLTGAFTYIPDKSDTVINNLYDPAIETYVESVKIYTEEAGLIVAQEIPLYVTGVNDPPQITNDTVIPQTEDRFKLITLTATDPDTPLEKLNYKIEMFPSPGYGWLWQFTDDINNRIQITPAYPWITDPQGRFFVEPPINVTSESGVIIDFTVSAFDGTSKSAPKLFTLELRPDVVPIVPPLETEP